jgi:dienelactone hydrolase
MAVDPLEDFEVTTETHRGTTRTVLRAGEGPAVVVIAEIPGITPSVAAFARRVTEVGCSVSLPSLFGSPGRAPGPAYLASSFGRVCISREFSLFATGRASPVTRWLRDHAARLHAECGGPGVGVVGMCLTGGFALAMSVDPVVVAPVLSQPSLPLPLGAARRRDLGVSDDDLAVIRRRADEGCPVLGLRFDHDRLVPIERFERLRQELGDAFVAVEIDSSPGNPHQIRGAAHSVLTEDLVDEPGHPTRDALEQVLGFLHERLVPSS